MITMLSSVYINKQKNKLRGLSPRMNYTESYPLNRPWRRIGM
jgi:hypothetical protein